MRGAWVKWTNAPHKYWIIPNYHAICLLIKDCIERAISIMKKFTLMLLALMFILITSSCTKNKSTTDVFMSNVSTLDGSNLYYVVDHTSINYINFETGESGILCYDPICSHQVGECQACISSYGEFMANIAAVRANCVYYVKDFENGDGKNEGFGIVEYDANAQTTKVLFKGAPDLITQFVVRGDDIYYFMNAYSENGKGIRNIYHYSLKNRKNELLTNAIEENLLFYHSEGENVYLANLDLGIIYQTDWTFRRLTKFKTLSASCPYFYIYDGYLYYFEETGKVEYYTWPRIIEEVVSETEEPFLYNDVYVNLVRVPVDDVDSTPQILLEHVSPSANLKFFSNAMLCVLKYPVYYKTDVIETIDIETGNPTTMLRDVYSMYGDLVAINLDTLDTTTIFPEGTYDIFNIYYYDGKKLVFYGENILKELTHTTSQSIMSIVQYDLSTKESMIRWEND